MVEYRSIKDSSWKKVSKIPIQILLTLVQIQYIEWPIAARKRCNAQSSSTYDLLSATVGVAKKTVGSDWDVRKVAV